MATKKLTIASGKASGTNSNMPLLLVPSEVTNIGAITLAEAQSARFYTDSSLTVEIAREVVAANELHFKGTSVSSASEFWMDYDGIRADYAVTDTFGRNAVWSDYVAVYHLNANSNDSTVNALNGTDTAMSYGTSFGKIGGGADFNGSTSIINLGNSSLMNFATTSYTLSSWAQPQADTGLIGIVSRRSGTSPNAGYGLGYDWTIGDGFSFVQRTTATVNWETNATGTSAINNWYHVVGVYNAGGNSHCYVDTVAGTLNTATRGSISSTENTYISALQSTSFKWNGYVDELRLRASALSANWITTEYNNQNDNGAFWVAENAGGGGGWNAYPIIHMLQFNCVM